jgi:hypothetical protein
MDMSAAVPLNGFWNTRPTNRARRCSGSRVMFQPSRSMRPSLTKNVPATALRNVDLPEPLVPTTARNPPSGRM